MKYDFISYSTLSLLSVDNDMIVRIIVEWMKDIEDIRTNFVEAFAKHDYVGMSELYSVDCKLMLPMLETIVSRDGKKS